MMQDSELGRLETFVAKLLDRFNALQVDKKRVDELLLQRDETISNLQDELASLRDERGVISSRVTGLLERIEEWEAESEEGDEAGTAARGTEGGVVQGSLF